MLGLLARSDESLHDVGEVRSELILEDLGHSSEEDERAFAEAGVVEDETLEGELDERLEVGPEDVLTDSLSDRAEGVGGNAAEVGLLALVLEGEEGLHPRDRGLEVRNEALLGGVRGRADGASNGGANGDRGVLKEDEKALHEEGKVLGDVVTKDLEVGVKGGAGRLLGGGVRDVVEEDLKERRELGSAEVLVQE